jgi:hypothetical protein
MECLASKSLIVGSSIPDDRKTIVRILSHAEFASASLGFRRAAPVPANSALCHIFGMITPKICCMGACSELILGFDVQSLAAHTPADVATMQFLRKARQAYNFVPAIAA